MTKPYTVAALAERWDCSTSHVYDLIGKGRLRFFTLGGRRYRIPADEVDRWESAGGDTRSESTTSGSSTAGPSSGGKMAASVSAESLAIQALK